MFVHRRTIRRHTFLVLSIGELFAGIHFVCLSIGELFAGIHFLCLSIGELFAGVHFLYLSTGEHLAGIHFVCLSIGELFAGNLRARSHRRNGRGGAYVPARTSAQRRFHP